MSIQLLPHLDPRQTLIRHTLLSNLKVAEPLGTFLGWSTLAIAGVLGVILNKLTDIQPLLHPSTLKWGLSLLALSLLFGAIAKQMSEALVFASKQIITISSDIFSEIGIELLSTAHLTPDTLADELGKCYFWPLSAFVRHSTRKGSTQFLISEIRLSRLLSVDLFISWAHFFAACAGIITLAFGIK